ncbi:MAG: M20/M25/M40 family metallo-hydrolase [Thermoanaerobaculia bacterium]
MLRSDLAGLGFREAERVPTDGNPGVWGFYDAGAPKTLVVYMMYDVQPVEIDAWSTDPFAGTLVERPGVGTLLVARGASNQKGPERAFLNALQAILAVDGTLPVNVMVVADGEEEIGSPHFQQVLAPYAERMRGAEGVVLLNTNQWSDGYTELPLGVKGLLYLELRASNGLDAPLHSSYAGVVPNPAIHLVQALASLTSPDGRTIAVSGYYDRVREPTAQDLAMIRGMSHDWGGLPLAEGLDPEGATADLLFLPTFNVSGITGGFVDEGMKTITPNTAKARIDTRLVPDMTPEDALERIRAHLAAGGFGDIEIEVLAAFPPGQSRADTSLVRAVVRSSNRWTDVVALAPRSGGAGPLYQLTGLGLPFCPVGMGFSDGAHAPNELMLIEPAEGLPPLGLAGVEKAYVDFLFALAEP